MASDKKKYATAGALRAALESRLKQIGQKEGHDYQRLMRWTAFDRLLARLFAEPDAPWVLKGGYALELRISEARVTRDLDLSLCQSLGQERGTPLNDAILSALKKAVNTDLGDFFEFDIGAPMMDLDGAPYGGARFPVDARLDGRSFVKFHVDIGAGDAVVTPLDSTQGRDWLGFAGIPAPTFPTITREQHYAEKLHAYTVPRTRPNTRVRDLVDMVLLLRTGLDAARAADAIRTTFKQRGTHAVPKALMPPPAAWTESFAKLAKPTGVTSDAAAAFALVRDHFDSLKLA